jgi:hypothetical protein
LIGEICGAGSLCWFLTGAELQILYWKQFLDKKCGIQNNWWF